MKTFPSLFSYDAEERQKWVLVESEDKRADGSPCGTPTVASSVVVDSFLRVFRTFWAIRANIWVDKPCGSLRPHSLRRFASEKML